mmetsp:Transcript_64492/g.104365  ORF Transcript_64492/g.104365 Transcript_64492/m.104365 type:complete len:312 (-) Transcript_64492:1249-2184(-)|eukprot:CAMPEP_0179415730 /NCGR_PEP_ID=MMETSP0799-20121207/6401_1 /TAXON_ID=46947 /ORGANISM="Geminigera cryophila, Strain CCMP2564" /LENGTH=311 /DNA_ID=CAMNT_0021188515 /DNA_START=18 /DNA_END=953 /DNA_ORIENTATION=-
MKGVRVLSGAISRGFTTASSKAGRSFSVPKIGRGLVAAGVFGGAATALWTERAYMAAAPPVALSPSEFKKFKCVNVERVTSNTNKYVFELPDGGVPGLTVASVLVCKVNIDGKDEIRPYTPVSGDETPGRMELVVKVYEQGKVSKAFGNLKAGDFMEMKGPFKKFEYKPNEKKEIGMVCGGSGITPMYQVIDAIVRNPADKTKVKLVFCNVAQEDIILKGQIDQWAQDPRVTVTYVLDKPPAGWQGGAGYLNQKMLKAWLPAPSADNMVYVCGPPPMMISVSGNKKSPADQGELSGLLADMGYTKEQVFKF